MRCSVLFYMYQALHFLQRPMHLRQHQKAIETISVQVELRTLHLSFLTVLWTYYMYLSLWSSTSIRGRDTDCSAMWQFHTYLMLGQQGSAYNNPSRPVLFINRYVCLLWWQYLFPFFLVHVSGITFFWFDWFVRSCKLVKLGLAWSHWPALRRARFHSVSFVFISWTFYLLLQEICVVAMGAPGKHHL